MGDAVGEAERGDDALLHLGVEEGQVGKVVLDQRFEAGQARADDAKVYLDDPVLQRTRGPNGEQGVLLTRKRREL